MKTSILVGSTEGVLGRNEMKSIMAGNSGPCTVTVTCPNGFWMSCSNSDGECFSDGDGTINGYINCGVGHTQNACWKHDPEWELYPEYQG